MTRAFLRIITVSSRTPDFETDSEWDAISFTDDNGKRFLVSRETHLKVSADREDTLSVEIWVPEGYGPLDADYDGMRNIAFKLSYNEFAEIIQHVLVLSGEHILTEEKED